MGLRQCEDMERWDGGRFKSWKGVTRELKSWKGRMEIGLSNRKVG